jgi:hypothetical protein
MFVAGERRLLVVMMRGKRRIWLVGVVAVVGAAAFAVWPRGSRLEWYTSPPLTIKGKTAHLSALVPSGWMASEPKFVTVDDREPGPDHDYVSVRLFPSKQSRLPEWVPSGIRRMLEEPIEPGARVSFMYGVSVNGPVGGVNAGKVLDRDQHWNATRSLDGPIDCEIQYDRNNQAAFEATYRPICESFRVVRE